MEIERKFLVRLEGTPGEAGEEKGEERAEPWRDAGAGARIRQGYLSTQPNAVVRVRVTDDGAWLTVKGPTRGISREELEYPIPREDGLVLLELCEGGIVEKTRYRVPHGDHVWEVDVFEGDNAGLVVAEVELAAEDETFDPPAWIGAEVSDDPRYRNASLSREPYARWRR